MYEEAPGVRLGRREYEYTLWYNMSKQCEKECKLCIYVHIQCCWFSF